uniref:Uncharacterized protein n=1 Tax=Percolomonas cosmopolitus TaxID=63605 RepID=A0A7S1PGM8_9EUKA|mmetsp:Transcript_3790/g.14393  ORF Transcript_3790/g.14393 Transcript_3790/m.14393 type:complete len:463 (+) Transcript_3790:214-1602(+)
MFRASPLVNKMQRSRRNAAFRNVAALHSQKRTLKVNVDHFFPGDMVPPTMAKFRNDMSELSKSSLYKYEIRGRRNNETVESLWASIEESYKETAPYKLTDEHVKFIHDYFGYPLEEIEMAHDLDAYKRIMLTEDGGFEHVPNWEKWKEHIGSGSSAMTEAITHMQEQWNAALKRYQGRATQAEVDQAEKNLHELDLSTFEGKIPKRTLDDIKKMYFMVVEKFAPDFDPNEMNRLGLVEMRRAYNEAADELGVMKKAYVTIPTERIVHYGPMFMTDEEGNYVWDYQSLAFVDRFFPEVRDLVLAEMAVENYRLEYPVEQKKYAITYEEIVQKVHKHTMDVRRQETDTKSNVATGGNKRQIELARQLQNVTDLLDEATQLSRESGDKSDDSETTAEKRKKQQAEQEEKAVKKTSAEDDEFVWVAIEEQTGQTRNEMFGGRSGNYEPVDINVMLDEEERAAQEKK